MGMGGHGWARMPLPLPFTLLTTKMATTEATNSIGIEKKDLKGIWNKPNSFHKYSNCTGNRLRKVWDGFSLPF